MAGTKESVLERLAAQAILPGIATSVAAIIIVRFGVLAAVAYYFT